MTYYKNFGNITQGTPCLTFPFSGFGGELFDDIEQILRNHMFYPAGILFGQRFIRADFHKRLRDNEMPFVDGGRLFFSGSREPYTAALVKFNIAFFVQQIDAAGNA